MDKLESNRNYLKSIESIALSIASYIVFESPAFFIKYNNEFLNLSSKLYYNKKSIEGENKRIIKKLISDSHSGGWEVSKDLILFWEN